MTYFSICSLSCSRAKNCVSFLISLMAPFSSFLYLCFIFPFSFSSFDAAFFFFLSSNLNNKTIFYWSFQNWALFIGTIYIDLYNVTSRSIHPPNRNLHFLYLGFKHLQGFGFTMWHTDLHSRFATPFF